MNFIDAIIGRSRAAILVLLFILLAGTTAYRHIAKEMNPDIKLPVILVGVHLEGISPEDGERLILRPLEKKLSGLENVKRMSSYAVEGQASVVIEFEAGSDNDKALRSVRVKVDEAQPDLPKDADEPTVDEINLSLFPIVNVILTGDVPQRTLVLLARSLRDRIESLSSVMEAKIAGDREEVVEIVVDPVKLEGYRLSLDDALQSVQANHLLVAAGTIATQQGEYTIKVPGLIDNVDDLRSVPMKMNGGMVVTVGDVADIRRTFKDPVNIARAGGKPAVVLGVSKRLGANVIDTVSEVKALVEKERAYWPRGIEVNYGQDISNETRDMLADLENGIIFAVLLVLIVMIWTMGMRAALLVAISIPGSFLFGILVLSAMDFTMNVVVLFALIMSVGELVDAAIVVCEYADRLMVNGMQRKQAYPQAAKRMFWPVIAATLTTKVVFLPLLFWPGIIGEFMVYLPITLLITLVGSLMMAMIFIPILGTWFGAPIVMSAADEAAVQAAYSGDLRDLMPFTRAYVAMLSKVLRKPGLFVLSMFGVLVGIYMMFAMAGPGLEFFPKIEPTNANILIHARGNLSVYEKDALVKQVEANILGMKEIRLAYTQSGKPVLQDAPEDLIGLIQLEFVNWRDRRKADDILAEIVKKSGDIPGIIVESGKQESGPPSGKPIQVEFASRRPELIEAEVVRFRKALSEIGGFMNTEDDRPIPAIEWELKVDRKKAGSYDASVLAVGNVVQLVTRGIKVAGYRPDDAEDEIDIVVRYPEMFRNLTQLEHLRVMTSKGLVPVTQFVTTVAKPKVGTVRRVDGNRVMTVKSDVQPGVNVDAKVKELRAWYEKNGVNPEVLPKFRGEDEEQQKQAAFLGNAFAIAIFLMFLAMIIQFNSIYDAVVIMSAVVFSTGGVLLGLMVTWQAFGVVMCGVGIISLAGIVVNNNIIFIDTLKELQHHGMELHEALLRTGAQRLRPILLTAGMTVLGLLPLTFGMNINFITREVTFGAPSSQWWNQLSTSIAGGLTFATILTLFFTPALLLMADNWVKKFKHRALHDN
ncbi:MAG: efflux RND transporter permease subunit [Alphaproteobacteria bacterium]|nr:efflux RND transporter permease subunit [Alphaproteobacteria bacterium]